MLIWINYSKQQCLNFINFVESENFQHLHRQSYFPLWIFTSKKSMLKVNKIHWSTLREVYDDYNSTYEKLLASHNDIFICQKHLKHLAIKVYKSLMNSNPEFTQPLFKNNTIPYNLLPARLSSYGKNVVQF